MDSQNCTPPYWKSASPLQPCWTAKQMKEFFLKIWYDNIHDLRMNIGRPCRVLENIQFEMADTDLDEAPEPYFRVNIWYRGSTYKEIKRVRSMDAQALIGRHYKIT